MRRSLSILFLSLFLLNIIGYYGVFLGLQYRSDVRIGNQLDNDNYNFGETVIIKIPVSLPYAANQTEFVRVDGKFEYQGEHYRLVKQMYANDVMTVVCVKDPESKRINEALSDYSKTFSDQQPDNQNNKVSIDFIKDFLCQAIAINTSSDGWAQEMTLTVHRTSLLPVHSLKLVNPPDSI